MIWIYVAIVLLVIAAIIQVWDMVERQGVSSNRTSNPQSHPMDMADRVAPVVGGRDRVCDCGDPGCPLP